MNPNPQRIRAHLNVLGHTGLGVTELRVFDPKPQVAYVDHPDHAVHLCRQLAGTTSGLYVGVQPRPLYLFEKAANQWMPAKGRCAKDKDIEFITACFWDIDVLSEARRQGHPASEAELARTLRAAQCVAGQPELKDSSVICCSGNGYYVIVPIAPLAVYDHEPAGRFKMFSENMARVIHDFDGTKVDFVYNVSRVMRLIGTWNKKGTAVSGRPHRCACFVGRCTVEKSFAVHYMIANTPLAQVYTAGPHTCREIACNLEKLQQCDFIHYCRRCASQVSQPLWFALITNLACLQGGRALIHELSALDPARYDYNDTEILIERVLDRQYRPVCCNTLMSMPVKHRQGKFVCSQQNRCHAKAPMYRAAMYTKYQRSENE